VPAIYVLIARDHRATGQEPASEVEPGAQLAK
jgi:hypothetical protein